MSTLYNISNHPYRRWSEKQREAAKEYATNVEDIKFPDVGTAITSEEMRVIAAELLAKSDIPSKAVVSVAGELTTTYALVAMLQEYGCLCLAPISEKVTGEDGKKRFEFVQFRAYPDFDKELYLGDILRYSGDYAVATKVEDGFENLGGPDDGIDQYYDQPLRGIGATGDGGEVKPVFVV